MKTAYQALCDQIDTDLQEATGTSESWVAAIRLLHDTVRTFSSQQAVCEMEGGITLVASWRRMEDGSYHQGGDITFSLYDDGLLQSTAHIKWCEFNWDTKRLENYPFTFYLTVSLIIDKYRGG